MHLKLEGIPDHIRKSRSNLLYQFSSRALSSQLFETLINCTIILKLVSE
jgi:hypothetical protein